MILTTYAAAFLCGCTGVVAPSPQQGALTYHPFDSAKVAMGFRSIGSAGYGYSRPDGAKLKAPQPVFDAVMLSLGFTDRNYPSVGALLAKSSKNAQTHDLLWVDWNGDGKLADDEKWTPMGGESVSGYQVFKPTVEPTRNGYPVHVLAACGDGNFISLVPAGYMETTVDVAGTSRKVAIVDCNCNGVYGDKTMLTSGTADGLMVDLNGNGEFDQVEPKSVRDIVTGEVLPLLRYTRLGSEDFYSVNVKDNATLSLERYTGELGAIEAKGMKGVFAVGEATEGTVVAYAEGPSCSLPVGNYKFVCFEYVVTDSAGNDWTVDIQDMNAKQTAISAAKPLALKGGLPFKVALKATSSNGGHSFSLDVKDAGGNKIASLQDAKGGRPTEPTLTISDAKGKVVKTMSFQYG